VGNRVQAGFQPEGQNVEEEEESSNVDHPKHYNVGQIEVIDVIEDWNLDFHLGNAVKYIARAEHKNNALEDISKAQWYLDRARELRRRT